MILKMILMVINHKSMFFISHRTREPSLRTLKSQKSRIIVTSIPNWKLGHLFTFLVRFYSFKNDYCERDEREMKEP